MIYKSDDGHDFSWFVFWLQKYLPNNKWKMNLDAGIRDSRRVVVFVLWSSLKTDIRHF